MTSLEKSLSGQNHWMIMTAKKLAVILLLIFLVNLCLGCANTIKDPEGPFCVINYVKDEVLCLDLKRIKDLELSSLSEIKHDMKSDPLVSSKVLFEADGYIAMPPRTWQSVQEFIDSLEGDSCERGLF